MVDVHSFERQVAPETLGAALPVLNLLSQPFNRVSMCCIFPMYSFSVKVNQNEFLLLAKNSTILLIYMVINFFKFLTTMSKSTMSSNLSHLCCFLTFQLPLPQIPLSLPLLFLFSLLLPPRTHVSDTYPELCKPGHELYSLHSQSYALSLTTSLKCTLFHQPSQ